MRFNRNLYKEAFKAGYKAGKKKLNEAWYDEDDDSEEDEYKDRLDDFEDDDEYVKYNNYPDWALDYAVNGEVGDLSEKELKQIQDFEHKVGEVVDWSENSYFSTRPLFGLATNCYDVIVRLNKD